MRAGKDQGGKGDGTEWKRPEIFRLKEVMKVLCDEMLLHRCYQAIVWWWWCTRGRGHGRRRHPQDWQRESPRKPWCQQNIYKGEDKKGGMEIPPREDPSCKFLERKLKRRNCQDKLKNLGPRGFY